MSDTSCPPQSKTSFPLGLNRRADGLEDLHALPRCETMELLVRLHWTRFGRDLPSLEGRNLLLSPTHLKLWTALSGGSND